MSEQLLPYSEHLEHERDYLFKPELAESFKEKAERKDICWQGQLDAGQKTIAALGLIFASRIDILISYIERKDTEEKQEFPHPLLIEIRKLQLTVAHILNAEQIDSFGKIRVQHVENLSDESLEGLLTIKVLLEGEENKSKYKSNKEINIPISPELAETLIPRITPEITKRKAGKYNHGVLKERYYLGEWRITEFLIPTSIGGDYFTAEIESEDTSTIHDIIDGVGPEITFDNRLDFFSQAELQIMNKLSLKKYKRYIRALRWKTWKSMLSQLINLGGKRKQPNPLSSASSQNPRPHE